MNHRRRFHFLAGALAALAVVVGAAAAPAAVATPAAVNAATVDPAAAATAYLQARDQAITVVDRAAVLAPWLGDGVLARSEAAIARGTARHAARLGHDIDSVSTDVAILDVQNDDDAVLVKAHVITSVSWHAASSGSSVEAAGVDHALTLAQRDGAWVVTADAYADPMTPAYLEDAGASSAVVRAAAQALERASVVRPAVPDRAYKWVSSAVRRYNDIIAYDRAAARAYADKYALSYNRTYVDFEADCCNFASQCGRAGDMPQAKADWDSGWWYDKNGTSGPGDDSYSFSWISVPRQMNFWDGRRTDVVSGISSLGRGDFVYYDWTGNGSWDHVAVVVGTNSAGQKIVDAHTSDYYHVFWKLGSSSTKFRFARVRAQWVI